MSKQWSKHWKGSKKPTKQRKYRDNAPLSVKDKLISANLSNDIRDELGIRSLPIKVGDRVKVMRGDESGQEAIVTAVDRENEVVYTNQIENSRLDGSKSKKALRPSNLQIQALNLDDLKRIERYDVEDVDAIRQDEEAIEEALEEAEEENEMMQQLQQGQESSEEVEEAIEEAVEEAEEEETEAEETEEETEAEEESTEADYSDIVKENIGDVKEQLNELENPDYEAALEAEKADKNRKTLIEYLENKVE